MLFVAINIFLTVRFVGEVAKVEDYCSAYANKLETPESRNNPNYWMEKIPPEEYTKSEKHWAELGRDVTRSRREIITCEDERGDQIKYFIFF